MTNSKSTKILGIIISMLLFFSIITGIFGLNSHHGLETASAFWLSRFEFWVLVILIYLFAKKVEKDKFLLWKEQRKNLLFYILSIIAILVFITVLLTGISVVLKNTGLSTNDQVVSSLNALLCNNLLLLIFTCLTAAITEELIFRGYILPRLDLLLKNKWLSIFLSALLFGLAHIGYGDFIRMLFPFIIGLIFGFYYYRYRSLAVLIICHFLMDFYSTYGACK
ncbi:MAG: type II CAAX endopeptidase family protein [Chitinophagaceae bacterium]